ncbi:hypothetical protein C8R45DRAFT_932380 [Mycena sanguinolenta]|nr:hypothetical protein C8R45DRAFT_932380 [Mycena sanguinolenta]
MLGGGVWSTGDARDLSKKNQAAELPKSLVAEGTKKRKRVGGSKKKAEEQLEEQEFGGELIRVVKHRSYFIHPECPSGNTLRSRKVKGKGKRALKSEDWEVLRIMAKGYHTAFNDKTMELWLRMATINRLSVEREYEELTERVHREVLGNPDLRLSPEVVQHFAFQPWGTMQRAPCPPPSPSQLHPSRYTGIPSHHLAIDRRVCPSGITPSLSKITDPH